MQFCQKIAIFVMTQISLLNFAENSSVLVWVLYSFFADPLLYSLAAPFEFYLYALLLLPVDCHVPFFSVPARRTVFQSCILSDQEDQFLMNIPYKSVLA